MIAAFASAVALAVFAGGCRLAASASPAPRAVGGVLDLSGWDFDRSGPVELNGEWSFYWKRLIPPDAIDGFADDAPVATLPAAWNDFEIDDHGGARAGPIGYATFRLRLILPPRPERAPGRLRLRIPEIGSAYRLYADGERIAGAGVVSPERGASRGEWTIGYAEFAWRPRVDLVLQISNHRFRSGGLWRPIQLGTQPDMNAREMRARAVEAFLIGAFLIIGLNHLTIFVGRRGFRATLYFGVLCLILTLQVTLSGEHMLAGLWPGISYRAHHTLLFLTIFCAIPVFALFEYHVFPAHFHPRALRAILICSALFCGLALVLPTLWLTGMHVLYKSFAVLAELYMIVVVWLALRAGDHSARFFLAGLLLLIPFTMVDVLLLSSAGFQNSYLVFWGFFVFLLLQSIMLSRRFTTALAMAEQKEAAELRLTQSELEYSRATVALEKIRFERLKSIIQPHYLLNSLTALLHWVRKNPAQAEDIVRDLAAEFQKVHLSSQRDFVSVSEEIELCAAHVRIMEIRYDRPIRFEARDLDPEAQIPPLIIHTLVENAFFHQTVREIRIESIAPGHFVVAIEGAVRPERKGLGIGLDYIEARLRTAYGDAWELKDRATPDGWATEIRVAQD